MTSRRSSVFLEEREGEGADEVEEEEEEREEKPPEEVEELGFV